MSDIAVERQVVVRLSNRLMVYAGMIGIFTRIGGLQRPGMYGIAQKEAGWDLDVGGAIAEAAVAQWRNVWWPNPWSGKESADVDRDVEVRSTRHSNGCLILRDRDHDERPYILAVLREPEVVLAGWMTGAKGKDQKFWRDLDNGRPGGWFVPQDKLWPMSDFPRAR